MKKTIETAENTINIPSKKNYQASPIDKFKRG